MKIQKFNDTDQATLITTVNNFVAGLTVVPGILNPYKINISYSKNTVAGVTTYYAQIAYTKP